MERKRKKEKKKLDMGKGKKEGRRKRPGRVGFFFWGFVFVFVKGSRRMFFTAKKKAPKKKCRQKGLISNPRLSEVVVVLALSFPPSWRLFSLFFVLVVVCCCCLLLVVMGGECVWLIGFGVMGLVCRAPLFI